MQWKRKGGRFEFVLSLFVGSHSAARATTLSLTVLYRLGLSLARFR